jgi:3-deoxy-D-manno-octulosonic acid kinase
LTETVEKTATGAILYDKAIINQISEDRFEPSGWLHSEPLTGSHGSGGRGNTMFVGNIPRQFVLRHFMRGGLIGKLVRDRYVWTGEDNTRAFVEWRLLAKLAVSNLRVPRPAAARYCRHGLTYTADIITVRIPEVHPLSEYIALRSRDEAFWHATGASIREFHGEAVDARLRSRSTAATGCLAAKDAGPAASFARQDKDPGPPRALRRRQLGNASRRLFQ